MTEQTRRKFLKSAGASLAAVNVAGFTAPGAAQTGREADRAGDGGLITDLRCEYLKDPVGVDAERPRLSWRIESPQKSFLQTAYRVCVASSYEKALVGAADFWDSGRVTSGACTQVVFAGPALKSCQRCWWSVQAWGEGGAAPLQSEPAFWETGLLDSKDWRASWVAHVVNDGGTGLLHSSLLRKSFTLDQTPRVARLYICGLGGYEAFLNGVRVGDELFEPQTTKASERLLYATYDVTAQLRAGGNVIGIWLGSGLYNRNIPGTQHRFPVLRAQLLVRFDNGDDEREELIVSDNTWRCAASPHSFLGKFQTSDYSGEEFDFQRLQQGWDAPGFDASAWAVAAAVGAPTGKLSSRMNEPNRSTATLEPVATTQLATDTTLFDFGQVLTGRVRLTVEGRAGVTLTLRYYDRLGLDGWPHPDSHFTQTDVIRLAGGDLLEWGVPFVPPEHQWASRFHFRCFRYVLVQRTRPTSGSEPVIRRIAAERIHNDVTPVGSFRCSNDLLNRIWAASRDTQRGLMMGGVPMDCAHREKAGYGGDADANLEQAIYNFDMAAFYTKWMADWRAEQDQRTGALPPIAPQHKPMRPAGGPFYANICITASWYVYLYYGDTKILRDNFAMMRGWVEYHLSRLENYFVPIRRYPGDEKPTYRSQYVGDWLPPKGAEPWSFESSQLFNTLHLIHTLDLYARITDVLGFREIGLSTRRTIDQMRRQVHARAYDSIRGCYFNGNQTFQAMTLLLRVVPEGERQRVADFLVGNIVKTQRGHLSTGMHGSFYVLKCLAEIGRNDVAYMILNQTDYPSWGHMLAAGGTTFREGWDESASNLHATFNSVGFWFCQALAGIQPDPERPGFEHVFIRPQPVLELSSVEAEYRSIRGPVRVSWTLRDSKLKLSVSIPANVTASVRVPGETADRKISSGTSLFE